jgi:hypothetical protein
VSEKGSSPRWLQWRAAEAMGVVAEHSPTQEKGEVAFYRRGVSWRSGNAHVKSLSTSWHGQWADDQWRKAAHRPVGGSMPCGAV